jgi:hypothetical protein
MKKQTKEETKLPLSHLLLERIKDINYQLDRYDELGYDLNEEKKKLVIEVQKLLKYEKLNEKTIK